MSNALSFPSLAVSSHTAPGVRLPTPRPSGTTLTAPHRPVFSAPRSPMASLNMAERMKIARERIRTAAVAGHRIRSYEVALDLDLSEFHFARQFRAAFGRSPHVFYDEVRAEVARALLAEGQAEGDVARRIGLRRPAELRALLAKRHAGDSEAPPAPGAVGL